MPDSHGSKIHCGSMSTRQVDVKRSWLLEKAEICGHLSTLNIQMLLIHSFVSLLLLLHHCFWVIPLSFFNNMPTTAGIYIIAESSKLLTSSLLHKTT